MLRGYSLWDSFVRNAAAFANQPAFEFAGSTLSHRELLDKAERYAGGLAARGVGPGDRVAVLSDGREEMILFLAACARIGAILAPVNWRLSVDEVGRILSNCQPKIVVAEPQYRHLVDAGREVTELPTDDGGRRDFAADWLAGPPPGIPDDLADRPLLIIYTAATDGEPRGATLSQANLVAGSIQMGLAITLGPQDAFLGALPYFHVMAIALSLAVNFAGGRTVVRPRFDAAEAAALIDTAGISMIGTFPPMLGALLDERDRQGLSFSSLRTCMGLDQAPTIERFEAACPGATFWSIYGQTEVSGNVTYGRWLDRPGAAGQAGPLSAVAVVDDTDLPLPVGGVGEIVVRGPTVFQGYWGRDAENAVVLRNSWHHTGDLGRFDADGWLWYQGRAPHKELIKPGGENVYPAEVEQALREHPSVGRAVVIGVPDEHWGEAVLAVCEASAGHAIDAAVLRDFVGSRLARYKRPKHVLVVDSLPLTAAGAPDRVAVRQMFGKYPAAA